MVEVKESFHQLWKREKGNSNAKPCIIKRAPLIDLTLEEMNNSILIENGTVSLLERLEVTKVLGFTDEDICTNDIFPVTHKLIYNYDFGDNWIVNITKEKDCKELLDKGCISKDELAEAEATVLSKHRPVCIHKEGIFVLDDVGGLSGFANFLKTIYESKDKEERSSYKEWARSLGWSNRKISNKLVL